LSGGTGAILHRWLHWSGARACGSGALRSCWSGTTRTAGTTGTARTAGTASWRTTGATRATGTAGTTGALIGVLSRVYRIRIACTRNPLFFSLGPCKVL
jgi:hypothetical protein